LENDNKEKEAGQVVITPALKRSREEVKRLEEGLSRTKTELERIKKENGKLKQENEKLKKQLQDLRKPPKWAKENRPTNEDGGRRLPSNLTLATSTTSIHLPPLK